MKKIADNVCVIIFFFPGKSSWIVFARLIQNLVENAIFKRQTLRSPYNAPVGPCAYHLTGSLTTIPLCSYHRYAKTLRKVARYDDAFIQLHHIEQAATVSIR